MTAPSDDLVANEFTPPEPIDGPTWIPWAVRQYRASLHRLACARQHLAADLAAVARSRTEMNDAERDWSHWREQLLHVTLEAVPPDADEDLRS